MAETTTTNTEVKTEKKGVQKYRITPEVEEYLVKIEKNLAFAKEKQCEKEFEEGGKYYAAFTKLVREAAILAGTQLRGAMQATLPAPERRPEFKAVVEKLQANALNKGFKDICEAFAKADVEAIKAVYRKIYSDYCDAYAAQVMPIKEVA